MNNELLFIVHAAAVGLGAVLASRFGREGLTAVIAIFALLANILITKEIVLCSLTVTATDVFTIGCGLALNILQDQYGFTAARRAVWVSFFCLVLYTVMVQLHLWYVPAPGDIGQLHYCALFARLPWISAASVIAYLISQYADCLIYGWIARHWVRAHSVVRNYGALMISQLLDTTLFTLIGLYGVMHSLGHIILVSYAIKVLTIIFVVPLAWKLRSLSFLPF